MAALPETFITAPAIAAARAYLSLSAAARRQANPTQPLHRQWAEETGAFVRHAYDALYDAISAERYINTGQLPDLPELRALTLTALEILTGSPDQDPDWTDFCRDILDGYKTVPAEPAHEPALT